MYFCPIYLIHLIGQKFLHFEKQIVFCTFLLWPLFMKIRRISLLNSSIFSLWVAFRFPISASVVPRCCRASVSSVFGLNSRASRAISWLEIYDGNWKNKEKFCKFFLTDTLCSDVCPGFQRQGGSFTGNGFLRFTSGAVPADYDMAGEPFWNKILADTHKQ